MTQELKDARKQLEKGLELVSEGLEGLFNGLAAKTDPDDDPDDEEKEETTPGRKKKGRKKKGKKKKSGKGKTTLDDVRAVFVDLIEEHGDEGADEVLEEFEVDKLSDLDPDDYAKAKAAAKKYIEDNEED